MAINFYSDINLISKDVKSNVARNKLIFIE